MNILINTKLKQKTTKEIDKHKKTEKYKEVKINSLINVKSFAGPDVLLRVTKIDPDGLGFFGTTGKEEMIKLKEFGVPFNLDSDPDIFEIFSYYENIIKKEDKRRRIIR